MSSRGYLLAVLEADDGTDSIDLRIHYLFRAGSPAVMWGDYPQPEDPDEIELDYVEIAVALSAHGKPWKRVLPGEQRFKHDLAAWAETYLDDHFADVIENVAADVGEAAEYRAELRADR